LALLLAVALVLPTLMVAPGIDGVSAASPQLRAIAAKAPDSMVRVIAQVTDQEAATAALDLLGGTMKADLYLIHAFAAEMSARAAVKLARTEGIGRVMLDAPMAKANVADTFTARDAFNDMSFGNNDGDLNWSSDWQEIGEDDGPYDGDLRISYEALRISDDHRGIQRTLDLSGANAATLYFDYGMTSFDDAYDYVALELSGDGGTTWTEIDRFEGPSSYFWRGYSPAAYDISAFIAADTTIRFTTSSHLGSWDRLYIDNLEVVMTMTPDPCPGCTPNTYLDTLNVGPVWEMGIEGQGVTIAVIDSGVAPDADFSAIVESRDFGSSVGDDPSGHGTHVAGIIAGNGTDSGGLYRGVAPQANLISIAISDETGMAYESDVIEGLQWLYENKETYNIRIVNISFNTTAEISYHESPMNAAAEILWFNGIVVVASAGNKGVADGPNPANAAPANDPFIITVGASHEQGTADRSDDTIGSFSASARTLDGFDKPDLIAPGKDIYSVLSVDSDWDLLYPERTVANGEYFRLSGTSMSAPMVSGAAALLLQDEPDLTPDQVKYRLMNSAGEIGSDLRMSYPYLDVYAAVTGTSTASANTGLLASNMLTTGDEPITSSVSWNSVSWNSVSWNSVSWNSVSWNSVSWNSVSWNSVSWNSVSWED
jgi:serine protease AprX